MISNGTNVQLVIPTMRLRDVAETVHDYRRNLDSYGHNEVPITVFSDANPETEEKEYQTLLDLGAQNVFYVGHLEKAEFLDHLIVRVGSQHAETLREAFRRPDPQQKNYGGNRNFAQLYTLGDKFMTADDDMRPHGLFHIDRSALGEQEVLKGQYVDKVRDKKLVELVEYDILGEVLRVLGKKVSEIHGQPYLQGNYMSDSMTDLLTNKTLGRLEPNTVSLVTGQPNPDSRIITAQTFRTGSADVDAVDYANDFLVNPNNAFVNDMSLRYVLTAFRPCVTKVNWRLDVGISSFDNTDGLPPFFPTGLRFEDYIIRLWLQKQDVAAAHVNAVQTHYKNPYNRASLGHDLWNEEMANYLKTKLGGMITDMTPLTINFEGDVHVTRDEARAIMEQKGRRYYLATIERAAEVLKNREFVAPLTPEQNANYLIGLARDLFLEFKGFDLDEFQISMQKTVESELDLTRRLIAVWPDLVETTREMKKQGKLPIRRVKTAQRRSDQQQAKK